MKTLLIWTYHRVLPEGGDAAVPLPVFKRQLAYLRERNYHFLDCAGLCKWINGELDPKQKYTMLAFDDGWADNLIWATPALAEFNAKAILALNTGLINPDTETRGESEYTIVSSKKALASAIYKNEFSSFLNWNELREISESGLWDIQAHGNSHAGCYRDFSDIRGFYPDAWHWSMEYALGEAPFPGAPRVRFASTLAHPKTSLADDLKSDLRNSIDRSSLKQLCKEHPSPIVTIESDSEFQDRVKGDLSTCKKLIKDNLGIEVDSMFWPWGHNSKTNEKIALELGFKRQFNMEKDVIKLKDPRISLPRVAAPSTYPKFVKRTKIFNNQLLRGLRKIFS